jgi:L-asparagine permease
VLEVAREREGFTGQFPVVANRPPPRDKDDKDK